MLCSKTRSYLAYQLLSAESESIIHNDRINMTAAQSAKLAFIGKNLVIEFNFKLKLGPSANRNCHSRGIGSLHAIHSKDVGVTGLARLIVKQHREPGCHG